MNSHHMGMLPPDFLTLNTEPCSGSGLDWGRHFPYHRAPPTTRVGIAMSVLKGLSLHMNLEDATLAV